LTGRNNATLAAARRLFAQCRAVCLRDPESLEYVQKEMPETNSSLIPDSLFSWFSLYANGSSHPPLNGDFLLPYLEKDEYWGKLDFSQRIYASEEEPWLPASLISRYDAMSISLMQ